MIKRQTDSQPRKATVNRLSEDSEGVSDTHFGTVYDIDACGKAVSSVADIYTLEVIHAGDSRVVSTYAVNA